MLRLEHVEIDEIERARGALDRVWARELDGVVVRGFLGDAPLARARARLSESERLATPVVPGAAIRMHGRPLQWNEPDADGYAEAARGVHRACADLLGPGVAWVERAHGVLGVLAGSVVEVPRTTAGDPLCPVTVRFFPPGAYVGPHHELTQLTFSPYAALLPRLDPSALLSFYVSVCPPLEGGELVIHDLPYDDPRSRELRDRGGEAAPLFGTLEPHVVPLRAGDLVVFDSGRLAHMVTTVRGPLTRCTIGGLLARDASRARVLSWA